MDVLDHLNDRPVCGLCGRLIPYSDDFCSECRRVSAGVSPRRSLEAKLDAELTAILAEAS